MKGEGLGQSSWTGTLQTGGIRGSERKLWDVQSEDEDEEELHSVKSIVLKINLVKCVENKMLGSREEWLKKVVVLSMCAGIETISKSQCRHEKSPRKGQTYKSNCRETASHPNQFHITNEIIQSIPR